MKLRRSTPPVVQGNIERRILLNYRIDPEVAAPLIPAPYRLKLCAGKAIGGICLIRITNIRPRYAPPIIGLSSENAACRFAVEWDTQDGVREGMFIPHRDTSSRLSSFLGGTILPGPYSHAHFIVYESFDELFVEMRTRTSDKPSLVVQGHIAARLPHTSIFPSLDAAAEFFAHHTAGYTDGAAPREFDGMKLPSREWQVIPLDITCIRSAYFDDTTRFPEGSIHFDSALLLRGVVTEWVKETWRVPAAAAEAARAG